MKYFIGIVFIVMSIGFMVNNFTFDEIVGIVLFVIGFHLWMTA